MDTTKIDQAFANLHNSLDAYSKQVRIAKKARRRARLHVIGGAVVLTALTAILIHEETK